MICKNCNHEIPPGCLFCMNCGAKAEPDGTETGTGSGTKTGPQNEETILNLTRQLQDASARIGYLEQQLNQGPSGEAEGGKTGSVSQRRLGHFFSFVFSALFFFTLFLCSNSA